MFVVEIKLTDKDKITHIRQMAFAVLAQIVYIITLSTVGVSFPETWSRCIRNVPSYSYT